MNKQKNYQNNSSNTLYLGKFGGHKN